MSIRDFVKATKNYKTSRTKKNIMLLCTVIFLDFGLWTSHGLKKWHVNGKTEVL